jgi:hypothetical protein
MGRKKGSIASSSSADDKTNHSPAIKGKAGSKTATKQASVDTSATKSGGSHCPADSIARKLPIPPSQTVSPEEGAFLNNFASLSLPPRAGEIDKRATKAAEDAVVAKAVSTLERFHMCILHNTLTQEDVATIHEEFIGLLDFKGDSAIGEKDASKRSGTRMYNCQCQVGPACGFNGWKVGSEKTRCALHDPNRPPMVWERVCNAFGFNHVARVEVVTSHVGCRNQAWHTDGTHGLTVIFALVDVDQRKGPTEIDFTYPFNTLRADQGKVKTKDPSSPDRCHAAMPAGSVLLFNANASHRGTANLSTGDRPILVLDTSPQCAQEDNSLWDL